MCCCVYNIEAYEGYNGCADDPVGELEVGIPLINSALEPAEWCTARPTGKSEKHIHALLLPMWYRLCGTVTENVALL